MANLANSKIKIVQAVTNVNSTSTNSKLVGSVISIGEQTDDFGDRIFYEDTLIGADLYRVCLETATGKIYLDKRNNRRAKSITITEYKTV